MSTDFLIRPARREDRASILTVVRHAFANGGRDGKEEIDIVVNTWSVDAAVQGLEVVATDSGTVVGYVRGARGELDRREVVGIAPLAVAPAHQGAGVGSALMAEVLRRADMAGLRLVVLLGYPGYYRRFGFEPSGPLNISYRPVGLDNPHFQVRRLAAYDPSYRGEFTYGWEHPIANSQDRVGAPKRASPNPTPDHPLQQPAAATKGPRLVRAGRVVGSAAVCV